MVERAPGLHLLKAAAALARRARTPFYLFDVATARETARAWRRMATTLGLEVFYPYKCNRHPRLVDLLVHEGLGAEATSSRDLAAALSGNLPGDRIVFQGPAKERASLDRALSALVLVVADGSEDALALLARARVLGIAPRYLLRFRASSCQPEQRRFGMSGDAIVAFARVLTREHGVAPLGLAFHLGTGISSPLPYRRAIREAGELATRLRALGVEVRVLDLGGGFPAKGESRRDERGRPRRTAPPPGPFLRDLAVRARAAIPGVGLLAEPGRALAADSFHLVMRVLKVQPRTVYVDASRMSHAFFVPRGRHPFSPIPFRPGARRREVAGPLAVGLDVLSASEAIGRPQEGDLLVIRSVGAYNLIASNEWAGERPEVVEWGGRES